jgi:hypothetical protein
MNIPKPIDKMDDTIKPRFVEEFGVGNSTIIGAFVPGMETGTNIIVGGSVVSTGASVIELSIGASVGRPLFCSVVSSSESAGVGSGVVFGGCVVGIGVGLGVVTGVVVFVVDPPTSPQHPKKTPSSVGQQLPHISAHASVAMHAAGSKTDGGAVIPSGILQSTSAKLYVTPSEQVNS